MAQQPVDLISLNPTGNGGITFGANDTPYLFVSLNNFISYPTSLNIGAVQLTPYGRTSANNLYYGPFLETNVNYVAFGVLVQLYMQTLSTAVTAGQLISARVDSMLLDLPG